MTRRLLAWLLLAATLRADIVYTDSDFDGVEDARDRCPETPFDLIVAADGCPENPPLPASFLVGLGASYATGDYGGTQRIDSLSSDLTAAAYLGDFYVSALGAYYFRGAYDPTVADYDGGGLSDLFVNASYALGLSDAFMLAPGINVKLATADDGLGTGENDFGAFVQGIWRLSGASLFFLYGYTVTGDSSTVTYRDVSYGSAGVSLYPDARSYVSLSYDASQAYNPGLPDLQTVSFYGEYALYDTLSFRINYSLGLSDSAADHYVSAMFLTRF